MVPRRAVSTLLLGMAAACATPGQVRGVETRIAAMERENARADSARAADLAKNRVLLEQLTESFAVFSSATTRSLDSLRQNARNAAYDMLGINRQLLALQTAAGSNAADLARYSAAIQQATNALQQTGSATAGAVMPGDEALMNLADRNIKGRAYAEARNNLRALIDSYPSSPQVPAAWLMLGQTFVSPVQPDSQRFYFTKVYEAFPNADKAPDAVYKLAQLADNAVPPDKNEARRWYKILVDTEKYRSAFQYALAVDWLKKNP